MRGLASDEAALTPYVRIDRDGVCIISPRAEMGQGVHTTLAALVAEELDVSLAEIRVEHGPAASTYFNAALFADEAPFRSTDTGFVAESMRQFMHVPAKFLGLQITGGSSSIPDAYDKMRKAGASARVVLLQAAARKLHRDINTLTTERGFVVSNDGIRLPYTELASLAADIEPPTDPQLKPKSHWRILGRSQQRVDMLAKCTGTGLFSIDVNLPGMLFATVRMNPHLGGTMVRFDATDAQTMPGVEKIVSLEGGVAVVATNTWYAFQAAKAIGIEWSEGPYPPSSEEHFAIVRSAMAGEPDTQLHDDGNVEDISADASIIEGEYRVPYLAHATMEPLNAVALLKDGRLDVWAGTQFPTQVVVEGAKIAEVPQDAVHVHTTLLGGGFGRRLEMDFIKTAISVAKALPRRPVKVTWSREEDMGHDTFRAACDREIPSRCRRWRTTEPRFKTCLALGRGFPVGASRDLRIGTRQNHCAGRLGPAL